MALNINRELATLQRMSVKDLKQKYSQVFGDETRTGNRVWLVRRIAWRLQSNDQGGLSERALARAAELANESDLRLTPPKVRPHHMDESGSPPTTTAHVVNFGQDDRLPIPGTILSREYKGRTLSVSVLPAGFEFEGEVYRSLSAVAKAITGTHCNGFLFFRLRKEVQR